VRAFLAIEIPESIRSALTALSARLRAADVRASWVKPENIHLTLRFLGDIETDDAERLGEMLAADLQGIGPFPVRVRGTGAFPNPRRPSVVWVGMEPFEGPLAQVQSAAEQAARAIGLDPESKAFHPHLTLARIRDGRAAGPLVRLLIQEHEFDAGEFIVEGATLFSSQLNPKGAIYRRIREFLFT